MTTTAAALNMADFEERREPTFVQWNTDGQAVAGRLVSIDSVDVGEPKKKAIRYTVLDEATPEGENPLYCFLGSYQINTKLRKDDIGKIIMVRYEGEDKTVSRNGNAMKVFKVLVSKAKPQTTNLHGLNITDDDIGF